MLLVSDGMSNTLSYYTDSYHKYLTRIKNIKMFLWLYGSTKNQSIGCHSIMCIYNSKYHTEPQ